MEKLLFIEADILTVVIFVFAIAAITIIFYGQVKKLKGSIKELISKNEENKELLTNCTASKKELSDEIVIQKQKNTDLISKVNREINTSVNVILGMATLLKDTYLTREQLKNAEAIINSSQHLLQNARSIFNGNPNQAKNITKPEIMNSQSSEKKLKHPVSPEFAKEYPMRILIAEDDQINQHLAVKMLNKLGYNPDIVSNGKEALEVVSEKNYDVILMDGLMPEMDGFEATRMIRLCLETQPVIIALTASTMYGDREKCLQAGMDDYISKPIDLNELAIKLQNCAEKKIAV